MSRLLQLGLVLAAAGGSLWAATPPPRRVIWSWNRPVPEGAPPAVAVRMASLYLGRDRVTVNLNQNPLPLEKHVYKMAVVRIDLPWDSRERGTFAEDQRRQASKLIVELHKRLQWPALQIDFDAPLSARGFYRELLRDVRLGIGRDVFLSMTALVSWCGHGSWLAGLDVDEMVPMTFDMGRETPSIRQEIVSGRALEFSGCQASLGVSAMDPVIEGQAEKRLYLWGWEEDLVRKAMRAYAK